MLSHTSYLILSQRPCSQSWQIRCNHSWHRPPCSHSLKYISCQCSRSHCSISDHIKLLSVICTVQIIFFSIFEPSDTSVQHSPHILPRALHSLSLVAIFTMPTQPWLASVVRIWNASSASKTHCLEWLLASADASASLRHWKSFTGRRSSVDRI